MTFLEFSTSNLTDAEADIIADAYFRASKDPSAMAKHLEIDHFDLNLLLHPLVKKRIVAKKQELNGVYSLEQHITKLQEIRDGAMGDENWKTALSAEVAVGKAAGLYEVKPIDPAEGTADAAKLSTNELRRRLAQATNLLTAPVDVPLDDSEEDEDSGEI